MVSCVTWQKLRGFKHIPPVFVVCSPHCEYFRTPFALLLPSLHNPVVGTISSVLSSPAINQCLFVISCETKISMDKHEQNLHYMNTSTCKIAFFQNGLKPNQDTLWHAIRDQYEKRISSWAICRLCENTWGKWHEALFLTPKQYLYVLSSSIICRLKQTDTTGAGLYCFASSAHYRHTCLKLSLVCLFHVKYFTIAYWTDAQKQIPGVETFLWPSFHQNSSEALLFEDPDAATGLFHSV